MNENNAWLTESALMDLEKQVQRDIPRFGPNVHIGVRAGLLREMLSKLRAPVADERTAFEAAIHDEYGTSAASMLLRDADGDYVTMNTEWMFWLKRAALASAPVAGEALTRFCPECGRVGDVSGGYRSCCPDGGSARMVPLSLAKKCRETFQLAIEPMRANAAPQASEADPLQGAADWLMRAFEPPLSASDLARQLVIGYNRATRLRDAALSAQPGAQKDEPTSE